MKLGPFILLPHARGGGPPSVTIYVTGRAEHYVTSIRDFICIISYWIICIIV